MLSDQHADPKDIQKSGRWLSEVFLEYIRSNTSTLRHWLRHQTMAYTI